jgi:hypothetical protein
MTRTISLIIGIAVVALVAVPTAFGEGRLAGSDEQTAVQYFKSNELATLVQQPVQLDHRTDAFGRTSSTQAQPATYKDANERVVQPQSVVAERLRSEGLNRMYGLGEFGTAASYKDANERVDIPSTPVEAPVATSGRDVEWPQVGIGFGIGIALAIVLGLSLKATRPRSLAH